MRDGDTGEQSSADCREYLQLIIGALPALGYRCQHADRLGWISRGARQITGYSTRELTREAGLWHSRVHPEDRADLAEARMRAMERREEFAIEYRFRHRAGRELWIADRGRGRQIAGGTVEVLGVVIDVTSRRHGEERRQRVSTEVRAARDDERRRISRELHDALGQTMTSISMRVAALQALGEGGATLGTLGTQLSELRKIASGAVSELSNLTHALRPPAVEDLGFVAALHGLVSELARSHGLAIDVHVRGLDPSGRLGPELEAALYRMMQESLNNVVKHAVADHASVVVEHRDGTITLIVEDDGCGFDVAATLGRASGLGLTGMRERAGLIGGEVVFESRPGNGTTVRVTVPRR